MRVPTSEKKKQATMVTPVAQQATAGKVPGRTVTPTPSEKPVTGWKRPTKEPTDGTLRIARAENALLSGNHATWEKTNKEKEPTGAAMMASPLYSGGAARVEKSLNPLLTDRGAQAAAEEKYSTETERPKTFSEIYLSNRDNPRVDELVEEMEREEADMEAVQNPAVSEYELGQAVYRNVMDAATRAGRQAEANAYDAARRGAGGAGTSYAAVAGAKAFRDAYAAEEERRQTLAEQKAEEEQAASEAAIAERDARMADVFDTMYNAYSEGMTTEQLRAYGEMRGLSSEDVDMIMDVIESKSTKDGAEADEKLGYSTEEAEELYSLIVGTDEDGNSLYTGKNRNELTAFLTNYGYDARAAEAAMDMADHVIQAGYTDINETLSEVVIGGNYNDAYSYVGMTAEQWAAMDEEAREDTVLDAMRSQIKAGRADTDAYAKAVLALRVENMDAAVEADEERTWAGKAWDAVSGTQGETILLDAADIVIELQHDFKDGYLTEEQYAECLQAVGERADIAAVKGKFDKATAWRVISDFLLPTGGGLLGNAIVGGAIGGILHHKDWTEQRRAALEELMQIMGG